MSKYWTISTQQWVRSLILAVISAILSLVISTLQNGGQVQWGTVGMTALIAGLSYVLHALGTDSGVGSPTQGQFLGKV